MKCVIIAVLMLLCGAAFSQSTETILTSNYDIRDAQIDNYQLIHTDLSGNVIWSTLINKNNTFDFTQGTYIVCGFTDIKNGKITANPNDYDYWLVKIVDDQEVLVYPNPAGNNLTVALNSYVDNLDFVLFDVNLKLLQSYKITNFSTTIQLPELSNGLYIYNIITTKKIIKIGKICVMQNN